MANPELTIEVGDVTQAGALQGGLVFSLDVKIGNGTQIARLLFPAADAGVFMQRFMRAAELAQTAQQSLPEEQRRVSSLPALRVEGVQIQPDEDLRSVRLTLHLGQSGGLSFLLAAETSRQMAESLIRHAAQVEAIPRH